MKMPASDIQRAKHSRASKSGGLRFGSFGKKSMLLRVLGTLVFQLQCLLIGLFHQDIDAIFFSTSPPLIGGIASLLRMFRRIPIAYWAMDLNPDQLIALGKIRPAGIGARFFEAINRVILRESSVVIALVRFMGERLVNRAILKNMIMVMPPWPHEDHIEPLDPDAENPFRARHGLNGKFVIMYSGNHSPANPLTTLLQAIVQLRDEPDLRFLFIGGGSGKREVEQAIREHGLTHAISLSYQPISELRYSLSAADVHVVSLGPGMVGIIHPCKIYGAMAAGRPLLCFGPRPSHLTDLLDNREIGLHLTHGDVAAAVRAIRTLQQTPAAELRQMGGRAQAVLRQNLSQRMLCARLCDRLERSLFPG